MKIPIGLLQLTGNLSNVTVEASTIREALSQLDALYPGLGSFILDEHKGLRRYVNIFVNHDNVREGEGLTTKLKDGDIVQIIPAVAGGK